MNSRRVLFVAALVAAIALAVAGAGTAHAAPPSGGITLPDHDGREFTDAGDVAVGVSFTAPPGATSRITDVVVVVESLRSERAQTVADAHGLDQSQYSGTWEEFDPGLLDYNGEYTITADATATDGPLDTTPETARRTRSFRLAVPPVQPAGVKAAFDSSKRTVAVSWTGNPEPDLLGYVVQRAKKGGSYLHLAEIEPGETTYTDEVGELEGEYSYRVVALREGAEDVNASATKAYEALNSDPSAPATAAIAPAPTTTESTPGTEPAAGGQQEPGSTSTSTSTKPAFESQGRVDLSGFAALLDQARAKPPAPPTTADPGFNDQLPYGSRPPTTGASTTGRPDVEIALADDDIELGENERLRSMTFLAGGVFAFVLLMHLVWIRNEVKHDPLPVDEHGGHGGHDGGGDEPPAEATEAIAPIAPIAPAGAATSNGRRPRRTGAGTLDTTPRKRSQGARGAPHRVPSRSRGDRREGRPAVRARR